MRTLKLLALLLLSQTVFAQIKVTKLTKSEIPASIKYIGHIVDAVRYTDAAGEHLIVTTETGKVKTKEEGIFNAELHAYSYKMDGELATLMWQVRDFVKDCDADIKATFVPGTFSVTDLDKDNRAEVWVMYWTDCTTDVSPSTMKIIMYQADKKYAVRGTTKVQVGFNTFEGGSYTFDDAFKTGPVVFRTYAADIWKKNMLVSWK